MDVRVAILCDNTAGLMTKAEHGLSVFLEVDGRSFLWDCGQTDVAVYNANLLGIDLRSVEGIGLSHGHADHAGGLWAVLSNSGPKKIYLHPGALAHRYFVAGAMKRYVGIPYRPEALEAMSQGMELNSGPIDVLPGVRLTGEVPRVTEFEGPEPNLFVGEGRELVPDPFTDDQALVVDAPDGAVVLTGCAHSGAVNILKHVLETTPSGSIKAVIGGTHLGMGAPISKVEATMDFLEEIRPQIMMFNHCTGSVVMSRMQDRFKERFIPGATGILLQV
jgi:7,8-dihydropterin-6-yl-methyl-4-(beta-D-ribofuranosyl)aminobenzene 5'-phosphate synthase